MNAGGFPIDLVLLGMIAAFLVLRLRSLLGKRTGFERNEAPARRTAMDGKVIDVRAEATPDKVSERVAKFGAPKPAERTLPDRGSPLGETLAQMQALDRGFAPARFLDGAEAAFRMIVIAYAKGDQAALKPLLGPQIGAAFEAGIAAREAAGETQHTVLHSIASTSIEGAVLSGSLADITVRFVSDQVSYTNDAKKLTIVGTEALTEITDHWTFERDLSSRDPAWRLVAAHS